MTPKAGQKIRYKPGRIVAIFLLLFCMTLVLTLIPDSSRVRANSLFGGLRSPGEAAFVASHRGDRTSAPENTLPAFRAAIKSSARFVETDVQLTKDKVPVLMHDSWVDRTTNGTGRVQDLTFAELERLDAGAWYSPRFIGTRVPTLESLLELLAEQAESTSPTRALVELKGFWSQGEAKLVTDLIEKYGLEKLVVLMSFDPVTLDNARVANDQISRAILAKSLGADPVGFAKLYGAIAIVTSVKTIESNRWVVDRIHRSGLAVLVYTLNTESSWDVAVTLGVDGIITDRPKPLKNWMSDLAK